MTGLAAVNPAAARQSECHEEPGAGILHAGIYGGDVGQPAFLR